MRRAATFVLLLLSLLIILAWSITPPQPQWVDTAYTSVFYTIVSKGLIPVTGALPVSVIGMAGLLGVAALLVTVVVSWRRRVATGNFVWRWLRRVGAAGLVVSALFILMWGANYRRTPLESRYRLNTERVQQAEVKRLVHELEIVVRRNVSTTPDWDASLEAGKRSLRKLIGTLEQRTITLPQYVKRTPPGLLIFTGQATGIISPWTLEAHIDGALPSAYALATALHELTHLAGYGGEAETDFIAGLAGLTAADPYTRYSVALVLFARISSNLSPAAYRTHYNALPIKAKADLQAFRDVYLRYQPPRLAAHLQARVYDSYLRTQGVGAGVADYDRVTDLLVAACRTGLLSFDGQTFSVKP